MKEAARLLEELASSALSRESRAARPRTQGQGATGNEWRPAAGSGMGPIGWFKSRYHSSSLRKFAEGTDMKSEDADAAVNTLTLVSALILTIPYSLVSAPVPS
jgi:hypothetical protein